MKIVLQLAGVVNTKQCNNCVVAKMPKNRYVCNKVFSKYVSENALDDQTPVNLRSI